MAAFLSCIGGGGGVEPIAGIENADVVDSRFPADFMDATASTHAVTICRGEHQAFGAGEASAIATRTRSAMNCANGPISPSMLARSSVAR